MSNALNEIRYERTAEQLIEAATHKFGIADDKGRALGFDFRIFYCEYAVLPSDAKSTFYSNPVKYIARTSVLRGGEKFGAITSTITGGTHDEVKAKVLARMNGAKARYTKKFA